MTAQNSPAARLRAGMAQGIVMAPGAADALTARLVERAGFPAVYMTGFGATAARLGLPDLGLMSQTEMTEHARIMTRAVTIPVVADADTGYGGPANIHRTVREHVQAGVAAIHLEDQVAPKRCGQLAGIRLVDAEENARRLACALEARGEDDLLIIGRTDALPAMGLDEAVRRPPSMPEQAWTSSSSTASSASPRSRRSPAPYRGRRWSRSSTAPRRWR